MQYAWTPILRYFTWTNHPSELSKLSMVSRIRCTSYMYTITRHPYMWRVEAFPKIWNDFQYHPQGIMNMSAKWLLLTLLMPVLYIIPRQIPFTHVFFISKKYHCVLSLFRLNVKNNPTKGPNCVIYTLKDHLVNHMIYFYLRPYFFNSFVYIATPIALTIKYLGKSTDDWWAAYFHEYTLSSIGAIASSNASMFCFKKNMPLQPTGGGTCIYTTCTANCIIIL